jgi:hypothetical protein
MPEPGNWLFFDKKLTSWHYIKKLKT